MKREEGLLVQMWKKRYSEQPIEIQKELDDMHMQEIRDYQLQVIKRKKSYPEIGDMFLVNPCGKVYFWGLVINNHVNNESFGDDLIVVMIFKAKARDIYETSFEPDFDNLLIEPAILTDDYWKKGYFYTVGNREKEEVNIDYGFYKRKPYNISYSKFVDELGKELNNPPKILGSYAIFTFLGVAYDIKRELIIDKSLLE